MKSFISLPLFTLLGCGLIAGLFFIFSVCIMKALGQLPPEKGMVTMQTINVVILNPLFLIVFMGTAVLCLAAFVSAVRHWSEPNARYLLAGSLCYLIGVMVVTMAVNVPMNDALAAANPDTPEGVKLWESYLVNWSAWNHVRTVAALAATALFALAR